MDETIVSLLRWIKGSQNEININLFSGLISGFLVLSLQFAVRASTFLVRDVYLGRLRVKRLFGFAASGPVIQVLSGSLQNKTPVLMGPDAKAAVRIQFTLESTFLRRSVFHTFAGKQSFTQIPQTDIVSVGGPTHNLCTRELLADFKSLVYFDSEDQLIVPCFGLTLKGADSKELNGEDFGLILRAPNPACPNHNILVLAGCGSHAVYAGALLFTDARRFPHLYGEFSRARGRLALLGNRHYLAIVRCRFRGGEIHNVHVDHVKTI